MEVYLVGKGQSGFAPCDTDIIFVCLLGSQITVAQPVVIEVVESGQTERTLMKGSKTIGYPF